MEAQQCSSMSLDTGNVGEAVSHAPRLPAWYNLLLPTYRYRCRLVVILLISICNSGYDMVNVDFFQTIVNVLVAA